ncbi:unnamed protein product [Rhizophagus irregularis]|nr:unnamed protein product [Rhizophagus irregularis]
MTSQARISFGLSPRFTLTSAEYRRLLNSGTLDPSQGTHILIINGKFVRYGSEEESKETRNKYPGCYYVPIKERSIKLRRFSTTEDDKEWQETLRISSK